MKCLAMYNIKGGVGKTAAAVNLAYLAASGGARTLIWDLDPQGASSFYLRVKPGIKGGGSKLVRGKSDVDHLIRGTDYEFLDLLPADFSYRHLDIVLDGEKKPTRRLRRVLKPLADSYDYIFLDCPPNISLVSEAVFETAHALIVPLIPTTLSMRTMRQLLDFKRKNNLDALKVMAFFSMVDRRKKLHKEMVNSHAGSWMLETDIPYASEVEQMGLKREPVSCYAPGGRSAVAYAALWSEIRDRS